MSAAMVRQNRMARLWRRPALWVAMLALFAGCYVGGPFLTLWRITRALDGGDVAVLQSLVDWTAVRQGLKDDIAEGVIGMPQQTLVASNTLPPFGASFISGIAGTEVDRSVTPEGLLQAARQIDPLPGAAAEMPFPAIVHAGFTAPTQFDLHLRGICQDSGEEPLHLRLALHGGGWQVVRVWVSQDLMECASSPT